MDNNIKSLESLGEFGLIERIKSEFEGMIQAGDLGIGDDAAVLNIPETHQLLVSTDMLNDGVHFLYEHISPKALAYKSLVVNLSDIAAMGGRPRATFLSLGLPKDIPYEYVKEYIEEYSKASKHFSTPLMGGDTTKSLNGLSINVTVLGVVARNSYITRSGAKVGDYICVTSNIGDSLAGLNIVLERQGQQGAKELSEIEMNLVQKHYFPTPRIEAGEYLALSGASAMMDLSDGLDSDLRHILNASNVNASIEIDNLPLSSNLQKLALERGWNAQELAYIGGEDYELLLTISPGNYNKVSQGFSEKFGFSLTKIGQIEGGDEVGQIRCYRGESEIEIIKKGFKHF